MKLHKKRILSFALASILASQSSLLCYASDFNDNDTLALMQNFNVYEDYQELVAADVIQISDLEESEDNHISYTLQRDDCLDAYVTQINLDDGGIQLNVQEGDLYNELIITNDNKLYLDGHEVIVNCLDEATSISMVDGDMTIADISISPRALSSVKYSDVPFAGEARNYTKTSGASKYSIDLSKNIASIGVTIFSTLLGTVFGNPLAGFLGGVAFAKQVIDVIAYEDPYAETLYYSVQNWSNTKVNTDPMVIYLKNRIKWFYDSKFKDEASELRETYYTKTTIRTV